MGSRIRFIQSLQDEADLIHLLDQKFELKCLPRQMESEDQSPQKPGTVSDINQVIFFDSWANEVQASVNPISNNENMFHVFPKDNLCLEWSRSQQPVENQFTSGRFYFSPDAEVPELATKDLKRLFNFIKREIQHTYPMLHPNKQPIYVGPHLWKMVQNGEAQVVFKQDYPIPLEPNPKLKA